MGGLPGSLILGQAWDPGLLHPVRGWVRTQEFYAWGHQKNHGVALKSQSIAQPVQGLGETAPSFLLLAK